MKESRDSLEITYLNDNFVGGETEFSAGTLINPEENKTLIFPVIGNLLIGVGKLPRGQSTFI